MFRLLCIYINVRYVFDTKDHLQTANVVFSLPDICLFASVCLQKNRETQKQSFTKIFNENKISI